MEIYCVKNIEKKKEFNNQYLILPLNWWYEFLGNGNHLYDSSHGCMKFSSFFLNV